MSRLDLPHVAAHPDCLTRQVALPTGESATVRLLLPGDGDAFGQFLQGLSDATRFLYAPHPLTLDQGRKLCADLDYPGLPSRPPPITLRFIGTMAATVPPAVVSPSQDVTQGRTTQPRTQFADRQDVGAYFILVLGVRDGEVKRYRDLGIDLDPAATCTFAPVVADALQGRGVGSALVTPVFDAARRLGFTCCVLMGGTRAINHRAIRFYEKAGFRKVGDFVTKAADGTPIDNQDMVMELR
ncbi:MAG: GNAT family N-acetyltransferase [Gemmatimonadota bacterium]